jgi:exodeoxyribonuclease VII large subunit
MNEKMSLTELQMVIRDSLYLALPDLYWIVAEISEIKENFAGHCYLELVEKLPGDQNIRARARGIIWSNRYRFLKSLFENMAGESLRAGIRVLIRVKIEYHEIYGLSLVINDIDPAYTIGEMAVRRQQILKRLGEEGVIEMNKELEFPIIPQRIAVVSSKNAAGYSDFMKHLTENAFGYVFRTSLFEAPMQGADTEAGVINALEMIASQAEHFDLVAIIRGGGSQTDLSWFDNYNIAYFVTQFPLPVITGIGHEKDMSVTDMVAFRALKTPTAVADFVVECMNSAENHLLEMSEEIIRLSRSTIDSAKLRIDSCRVKLIPVARMMLSELKGQLSGTIIELINIGKEYIVRAGLLPASQRSRLAAACKASVTTRNSVLLRHSQSLSKSLSAFMNLKFSKLESLEKSIRFLDPVNVLKRGYTITSMNGKIITIAGSLRKGDTIETMFSDGTIGSKVLKESGETQ